jgi:hypothetical protein
MTPDTARKPSQRENHTIILLIGQEEYAPIVPVWHQFRARIDRQYRLHPELFPDTFVEKEYKLHDHTTSEKTGVMTRRIKLRNGEVWTVHPSFVLPYMSGYTAEVSNALLLRKYGVPYEVLSKIFGKDDNYWYRLELQFGRKSIVGTTVKTVPIPGDLLADEHHEKINGEKTYIATTVAEGCILGAEVSPSASMEDLKKAYGVFKDEALAVEPEFVPSTINTDGWSGTIGALSALFPMTVLVRCFLHAWLRIRDRSKNLKAQFFEIGERVWGIYYSSTRRIMRTRICRLSDWARENLSGIVLAKVLDLCDKEKEWSLWYEHESAYRTSNELDRLMRRQNDYFDRGQHFHGDRESANRRSRAWAILQNYWDWGRKTQKANGDCRCPAERLNGKRYAENWLENLLVATSAVPKAKPPLNPA